MTTPNVLKPDVLRRCGAKGTDAELLEWGTAFEAACDKFEINTHKRLTYFLGQILEESGGLTVVLENLNYTAAHLMKVWPREFPSLAMALQYQHSPEKLANFIYANHVGNGPPLSGDGFRYRGRCPMQLTFKGAYKQCGDATGLDLVNHPELLEQKTEGALASAWYWHVRGCNELADKDDLEGITRKVNGGLTNLDTRKHYTDLADAALGHEPKDSDAK